MSIAVFIAPTVAFGLFLALSIGTDARSRGLGEEEIVKRTRAAYEETKTAEVRFEQMGRTGVTTGTLQFAQGNRYRLDLGQQTIVSNGSAVWTWSPQRNQVVISKASAGRGQLTPRDILTQFPGSYATSLVGESKVDGRDSYVIRCVAGGQKIGDITEATLYIDRSTFRFNRIELKSPSMGDITVRVLSASYNLDIPDSRFSFRPPVGARVIDLRR